jgi:hypothetical protein
MLVGVVAAGSALLAEAVMKAVRIPLAQVVHLL